MSRSNSLLPKLNRQVTKTNNLVTKQKEEERSEVEESCCKTDSFVDDQEFIENEEEKKV